MRRAVAPCLTVILLLQIASVEAAEKGLIIRAGNLMTQPFIDAANSGALTPNQPVIILERRGGWASVETNGQKGWVRLLNIRLQPGAANQPANTASRPRPTGLNPMALLGTGSSGRTVTTGVKGMDEEDIRNASVDYAQLEQLNALGVEATEARANAQKSNLKENNVEYLDKGRGQ